MELLVILLAEALVALLAPLFGLLAGLFALLLELLLALFTARGLGRRKRRKAVSPADTKPGIRQPVSRRWLHVPAIIAGVAGLAVLVAKVFLFEPTLRYGLNRIGEKTGYAVEFTAASGNLLTGRLALEGVTIRRDAADGPSADLSIGRAAIDVAMLSLLSSERRLETMDISGIRGSLALPPKAEAEAEAGEKKRRKPRRKFVIETGRIADLDLAITPYGAKTHRVEIITAEMAPFRSRLAVFDLFFRSTLDARIDGTSLSVASAPIAGEGRRTEFHFDEVPGVLLADLVGRAPLDWLKDGTISVHVEDEWARAERTIDMDWSIVLQGVRVVAPQGSGLTEKLGVAALGKFLNSRDGNADFNLVLTLDQDGLESSTSGDLTALWDALKEGLAAAVAVKTGAAKGVVKDKIDKTGTFLRDLIDPSGGSAEPGEP